jgi:hypothetical protein
VSAGKTTFKEHRKITGLSMWSEEIGCLQRLQRKVVGRGKWQQEELNLANFIE